MTNATWWLTKKDRVQVVAPPTAPPDLVDPAEVEWVPGRVYDLYVNNVGGAATSWIVDWLPGGLSYDEFADRIHIYGTAEALAAPVVINPGNQTWYVGEPIDLTINLDLSAGDPAETITAIPLVSGLSVTESSQSHIRITGLAGAPVIDETTTPDRTYYQGQSFDFEIKNIGDGAATWDVDRLPDGLLSEEVDGFTLRIYGVVGGGTDVPSVIDPGDQLAEVSQPYSLQLSATNSPTSWDATGLPTGLSIDNAGLISGTPTVQEFTTASVTATNAGGTSAPVTIDYTIHGAATDAPQLINPGNQTITEGEDYSLTIPNIGGPVDDPSGWRIRDGWLPPSLAVTSVGPYGLLIEDTPISIVSPSTPTWTTGSPVTHQVDYTGRPAGYSFLDFDNSLELWWRFEDASTVHDWSGKGHVGIYESGASQNTSGRYGSGMETNRGYASTSQYGFGFRLEADKDITISCWAKIVSTAQHQRLVYIGGNLDVLLLIYRHISGGLTLSYRDGNSDGSLTISTAVLPADDAWHHWAVVMDKVAGETRYYIDGSLQDTTALDPVPKLIGANRVFCGHSTDPPDGTLDELLIFSRALSDSEIQALSGVVANTLTTTYAANELDSYRWTIHHIVDDGSYSQIDAGSVLLDQPGTPPVVTPLSPTGDSHMASSVDFKFHAKSTVTGVDLTSATLWLGPDAGSLTERGTVVLSGAEDTGTISETGLSGSYAWNVVVTDANASETTSANQTFSVGNADLHVATDGLDTNPGTEAEPFLTIQKFCDVARPGDTCTIHGGTYRESATLTTSGTEDQRITIQAKEGETVIIDGTEEVSGFSLYSGNIYQVAFPQSLGRGFDQLFEDRVMRLEARVPTDDTLFDDELRTAYIIDSGSSWNSTTVNINSSSLTEEDDYWVGTSLHMTWSPRYHTATAVVTSSTPGSLTGTFDTVGAGRGDINSSGQFYLWGTLKCLTDAGEWAVESGTLYLWATDGADPSTHTIEMKQRDLGIAIDGSYVTLKGVQLFACNATVGKDTSHVVVDNITGDYLSHYSVLTDSTMGSGEYGLLDSGIVLNGRHNVIRNSTLTYSAGNGVALLGEDNSVQGCTVSWCNYQLTGCACIGTGKRSTYGNSITGCYAHHSGRAVVEHTDALKFSITYNTMHDCSYDNWTWDNGNTYAIRTDNFMAPIAYNRFIQRLVKYGIYLDSNCVNYHVHHNLVEEGGNGISILCNGYQGHVIEHNTGLESIWCNRASSPPNRVTIRNNIARVVNGRLDDVETPIGPSEGIVSNNVILEDLTAQERTDLFTDETNDDFTLGPVSVAIDYGLDLGYFVDYVWNPRSVGLAPDAGVYERQ